MFYVALSTFLASKQDEYTKATLSISAARKTEVATFVRSYTGDKGGGGGVLAFLTCLFLSVFLVCEIFANKRVLYLCC